MKFEKFPSLSWNQKKLIWDSRQEGSANEQIFLGLDASDDLRSALIARAHGNLVYDGSVRVEALGEWSSKAVSEAYKKLKMIGITGTNGKTSCSFLCSHILAKMGCHVLQIGTLGVGLWKGKQGLVESIETGFTTPLAPQFHHLLWQAVAEGFTHVVMEVSSHAVELGRISGAIFDGALFTNLSQDHLDFHKTMESYESAKKRFFTQYTHEKSINVICQDSDAGKRVAQNSKLPGQTFVYQTEQFVVKNQIDGLRLKLKDGFEFQTALVGHHNAQNVIGSLHLCAGILQKTPESLAPLLTDFTGIPGRLEMNLEARKKGYFVFVDYAHTPDALEKVLATLQSTKNKSGRLLVVFGCGGDRDKGKRPMMGAIAEKMADRIYVTSDNPRTEDPATIIKDIAAGFENTKQGHVHLELDRKKAIHAALGNLQPGDVLVIAGKGHENYQIIGSTKNHFSDQECVTEYFK